MKRILPYLLCFLLAIPVAIIVTFASSPFWNWFESVSGIESFGHSGPADWCFAATYVILVSVSALCYALARKKN